MCKYNKAYKTSFIIVAIYYSGNPVGNNLTKRSYNDNFISFITSIKYVCYTKALYKGVIVSCLQLYSVLTSLYTYSKLYYVVSKLIIFRAIGILLF